MEPVCISRVSCARVVKTAGRAPGSSANATDVVFADLPHPGIAFHPRADPPPQYRLQLRPMQIPPAAPHAQWWIQDATTMPGDAIALALTGQTVGGGAVATVRGGNITLQAFPTPVPVPTTSAYAAELPTAARNYVRPVTPTRIVSDSGGTIWLNDSIQPVVYAMHGSVTSSRKLGDVKLRRGSNSVGLAFAGRLWYSSIEPAPRIASVDGTRSFDLPSQVGPIRMLRTGSDGQLWFANEKVYGRMSLDGKFSLWPFPAPQGWRTYPEPVFVAGLAHTMWLAAGASIWKITDGVIARQYHLPDRILGVRTLAQQCDGSLLVAPDDAQLLRIATSGAIEQYDIPYQQIDALLRGADCKMWFAAGTNSPQQFTGTLSLAPR